MRSTSTSFQLLYGRLSDIWSRKIILLVGIAIFFFGSLASSLSQNAVQLIVFRAFTGVGGGGLMTVAQFIVSDVVPLRERGKYQGILVGSGSLCLYQRRVLTADFTGCIRGSRKRCWTCHWWCACFSIRAVMVCHGHFSAAGWTDEKGAGYSDLTYRSA